MDWLRPEDGETPREPQGIAASRLRWSSYFTMVAAWAEGPAGTTPSCCINVS